MQLGRGIGAATLVVALVVGLLPLGAGAVGTFDDDDGNIHESAIENIAALGITLGCNPPANTLYCPDDYVTRQQMASFLVRTFDLPPGPAGQFTDTAGSVHENDINALAASGITRGCNPPANTQYCPTDLVTRGQMAAFMARGLGLENISDPDFFSDDDDSIFELQINAIARVGITRGCNPPANTEYCPQNPVRRDEMASFLSRVAAIETTGTTSTTTPASTTTTTTTQGSTTSTTAATTTTTTTTTTTPKPPTGWATMQDLSDPVADAAGAALNGILYVAGGKRSTDNRVDDFLAYDPIVNAWTTLQDLPGTGREDVSLVAAGDSIYVFGGASSDPFEGNVTLAARFTPGSGWSNAAVEDLPAGRSGAAAVAYGGDIWLIGGFGPAGTSLSSVLIYDITDDTYSQGPSLPSPRDHAAAVVHDGDLYVFGGRNRGVGEPTQVIRLTSPSDQTWQTVGQAMPRARRSFVIGVAEDRIQLFGGESQAQQAIAEVDEFDAGSGTWSTSLPDMPTPRHGPAGATIDFSTYVIGGSLTSGVTATDVNERFTR
jgi:N-acetylneuraminic acid mutarotase